MGRGLRRTELFLLDSLQSQGRQAAIRIRLPGIHGFSVSVDILRFRTAFTEQDEEVRVYNLPHVQLTVPPFSSIIYIHLQQLSESCVLRSCFGIR